MMDGYYEDYMGNGDAEPPPYWDEDEELIDGVGFANPGSALRAATPGNPRIFECGNCGEPNRLTALDVDMGYQCDTCADRAEGKYVGGDY